MKPVDYARVKDLVLRLADLPEPERRALLDEVCEGDPALRREVEALLAHEESTTEALKTRSVLMRELDATPPPARLIGSTIGHYTILEFRGEGGMGEVYKAEDTRLKRPVALKFVRRDLIGSERLKVRFVEEARAAAALDHPNICTVHAIEEWEGQLFLVMAYVEGETLRDRIDREPLGIPEVLGIAIQAARGLDAAHAKGVVHRDIKSANIMLSGDRRPLIVDFGLARSAVRPETSDSGAMMGTIAYMSPEQARWNPVDHRADLWSLGVVIYEMITGRLPFQGESEKEIIRALCDDEPEPCRVLRPDTPPELERIISRAIAKNPDDRYASAAELLADLERLRRRIEFRTDPRLRFALIAAGAIVIVLGGLLVRGLVLRGENASVPRAQPRQVTSADAWEGDPALSSDGTRIAYASDESGTSEINLIDVHGGNPVQLTKGPGPSSHPTWFPDGGSIAFVSERGGERGVWMTSSFDGSVDAATLLVPHADDPAISPDGKRIAFVRPGASREMRIYVASVAGPSDSVMLTHDSDGTWDHRNPTWSPDGREILYAAERGLWIVPSSGGIARPLTLNEADTQPVWSPEGRNVYFASYREGTFALWRSGVDGHHLLRLTIGTGPESHPSISKDGAKLAYTTGMTGNEMFLLDRSTGQQVRVPGVRNSFMAAIAPDGSKLVFVTERWDNDYELWIQPLDEGRPSGDPRRLTDQPGIASHPVFSPDGRWIAYYLIQNDRRDIWIVSASGGAPIRFTDDPAAAIQPAWSPDGKHLAYISERGGGSHVWVAPAEEGRGTGTPVQLTTGDIDAFHPAWSPDGKTIAFAGGRKEEQEVWLVRSDGAKPPLRITSGGSVGSIRWDRVSGHLLVSGFWGGEQVTLRRISLDNGSTELEPPVDFGSVHSTGLFDVSADGRWLVYPRAEDKGDVWVLEAKAGSY